MAFDVIVIGSGFGGAITACRLAESGRKVLVLERGRRWNNKNFPRKPTDPWVWDNRNPEKFSGWMDVRAFGGMTVAQGAAVGGGSHVYANISCEAPARIFERGWPPEVRFADLKPHYDTVKKVMNVQEVPDNQWTARMKLMKEAAEKAGFGNRFQKLELAVNFDPDWTYDRFGEGVAASKIGPNAHGAEQGTCVHLANCDFGCEVHAKNTLDRNYLWLAEEKHHADVRPLHIVTNIEPVGAAGYRVSFDDIASGVRKAGSETAKTVILAAGSLGSTELLLRCRDESKSLPDISQRLGVGWSSNGDFLTPAIHNGRHVDPTKGPTICSAINFLDGSQNGKIFWIEDGGFPSFSVQSMADDGSTPGIGRAFQAFMLQIQRGLQEAEPFKDIMPWFAQGVDAANGTLNLRPQLNGKKELGLDWNIQQSKPVMDTIVAMHQTLSKATGGRAIVPLPWVFGNNLVTPHPLGGCKMGTSAKNGVVDHRGEVFGYKGLYVADGAIVPTALGVNPSRTIGALAERIASLIVAGH